MVLFVSSHIFANTYFLFRDLGNSSYEEIRVIIKNTDIKSSIDLSPQEEQFVIDNIIHNKKILQWESKLL
jgi:hypothetical protein